MKRDILILCEGVTDQIFIADCLEIFYSIKTNREAKKNNIDVTFDGGRIESIEGCENLKMEVNLYKIKDNHENGGVNIVILDADEIGRGNNSFENASKSLIDIKKNHKVVFDFYLWPNHCDNGEVEHLISQLIHPDRRPIMECIVNHQLCLSKTGFSDLRTATLKNLIRFYLHTNSIDRTEGRYVDYKNDILWYLNPIEILDLKKLKDFLDQEFLHYSHIRQIID